MMFKLILYYIFARLRGLYQNYIKQKDYNPCLPDHLCGTSCGLHKFSDVKTMYFKHGWIPYAITRNSGVFYEL